MSEKKKTLCVQEIMTSYIKHLKIQEKELNTKKIALLYECGSFYRIYGVQNSKETIGDVVNIREVLELTYYTSSRDCVSAESRGDGVPNNNKYRPLMIKFPKPLLKEYAEKLGLKGYYTVVYKLKDNNSKRVYHKTFPPISVKNDPKEETFSNKDSCECPVCLESIGIGENDTYTPRCNHPIHLECCKGLTKLVCPVCRGDISPPREIKNKIKKNEKERRREIESDLGSSGSFSTTSDGGNTMLNVVVRGLMSLRDELSSSENVSTSSRAHHSVSVSGSRLVGHSVTDTNLLALRAAHDFLISLEEELRTTNPEPVNERPRPRRRGRPPRNRSQSLRTEVPLELRGLVSPEEYRYNLSSLRGE